ncbi:MAG TPA: DUF2249 domain-containing protein [Gammaproteobacteria bacterium]|nr:DUF2249 domain-containing protein [Gammaproteobacteria bacterium]
MDREIRLDVSALAAPEPLERVLEALETLQPGQYVRMLHRREPFPLYGMLTEDGFLYLTRPGQSAAYEIFIWHREDPEAEAAVGNLVED